MNNNNNSNRFNENFIEIMESLSDIMLKKGETFRARAYQKAQETIMTITTDIKNIDDLKGKPNIGPTILEKLNEFILTGTLQILEREKNNPINIFTEIYGIGPKKAEELVTAGITTLEQLKSNSHDVLNNIQQVGLKYYEDILKRIPRSEIDEYNKIFNNAFDKTTTDSKYEIVGSFRRGHQNSGDIDVIITSKSPAIFINFIDKLISQKIIIEVLSRGPSKCLVIGRLNASSFARRIDFLYTSPEEFPFSILYFTGSKIFNTVMRHQALTMGLSMNEHGLYVIKDSKKTDKVEATFTSEKDIFDYLNMEYKAPQERIDGRAVIIKSSNMILSQATAPKINSTPKNKTKTKTKTLKKKDQINKPLIIEPSSIDVFIHNFKKNGVKELQQLNENEYTYVLKELNKAYYNDTPILTDNEYDIIKDMFEKKYPSSNLKLEVGAPIERNKAVLPYQMASMDKIKPDTNMLSSWTQKYTGPYVLSCKLDGVSGLYTTEGPVPKLYTRGDGKIGQDISHLIPYLKLPQNTIINNKIIPVVIRGEFIISKQVFEAKYKNEFANPRNMVAGIINQKQISNKISDISFVAYELIKPILKPKEQLDFLTNNLKIECVFNRLEATISNELLSQNLIDQRKLYKYEIDGIIVTNNQIYERPKTVANPEHAFAFKMVLSEQMAEATVIDVIWTPSKDGYLKPRVQITPIHLNGVQIEYATGFNGAFIYNNKIGIGAIIKIIRSGDVIPHILSVTVPASAPKMPAQSYKWNETNVDIILENMDQDETVREKNITGFFKGIEVDGLGSGNVNRIIEAGFDTIQKIMKMTIEDYLKVDGFKTKMATKIHDGIKEKVVSASLITLMSSSNLFGRGLSEKKIEPIMNEYPDILTSKETKAQKIQKIQSIKGMAEKSATLFVDNIESFVDFLKYIGLEYKLIQYKNEENEKEKEKDTVLTQTGPLYNKTIVMTGFRDKEIESYLKSVGAKLGASVSKNTYLVLVKNLEEDTGKALDAKKLGVPLITVEEFNKQYL
jgi:DNA ligase (NAD+)